jgi:ribulose-phosphate 3-epimerase
VPEQFGSIFQIHTTINFYQAIRIFTIDQVDMVLLMSVFAGYGGQKFMEETYARIDELKALIDSKNPDCLIEIDGGVNLENAPKLFRHGANVLVAGSTVFNAPDPEKMIVELLGE